MPTGRIEAQHPSKSCLAPIQTLPLPSDLEQLSMTTGSAPARLNKDQAQSSFINCEWIYSPNTAERHFSSLNRTVLCLLKIFRAGIFPSRHRDTAPQELMELDWLTPVEKPAQDLTGLILNRFHSDSNFSTLHPPSGTHLISCMANL